MSEFPRITRDPKIMEGKPCIRGMRVTIGMIAGQISAGNSIDEMLEHFPYLEPDDILEAIGYAGAVASNSEYDLAGSKLKVVIDMNLSVMWTAYLRERGHDAKHGSEIGTYDAADEEIMEHCRNEESVLISGDLDLSTLHAIQSTDSPSVIQLRSKDRLPSSIGPLVARALTVGAENLKLGAIVTISSTRMRVAKLPIGSTEPR